MLEKHTINAYIFEVTQRIIVNSDTAFEVGDIVLVNEDGYDGAWGDNLTQGFGVQPFCQYESVKELDHKWIDINNYFALKEKRIQLGEGNTFPITVL